MLLNCKEKPANYITFKEDIEVLQPVEDLTILKHKDAMIAVSGAYQGRVFTSTSKGMQGRSYGYFNKAVISEGNSSSNLAKIGGESRMWFGPQFGKFSVFFEPDVPQTDDFIAISSDLNSVLFEMIEKDDTSITYGSDLTIRNSSAYKFKLNAKRKICLKTSNQIAEELQITLNEKVDAVAFSAETWIQNVGNEQWTKENGLLSIWDLSCKNTTPNTVVAIPTRNNLDSVVNYFTSLESDRISIKNNTVFYKTDAAYMNKIGVLPEHCLPVFGSYSPETNVLTIATYHFEDEKLYANSIPDNTTPFKGTVIDIFNGEVNKELDRNWPFFEMETSSAMKELQPQEEMYHKQSIYHFEGAKNYLNEISTKVLGVNIDDFKI